MSDEHVAYLREVLEADEQHAAAIAATRYRIAWRSRAGWGHGEPDYDNYKAARDAARELNIEHIGIVHWAEVVEEPE